MPHGTASTTAARHTVCCRLFQPNHKIQSFAGAAPFSPAGCTLQVVVHVTHDHKIMQSRQSRRGTKGGPWYKHPRRILGPSAARLRQASRPCGAGSCGQAPRSSRSSPSLHCCRPSAAQGAGADGGRLPLRGYAPPGRRGLGEAGLVERHASPPSEPLHAVPLRLAVSDEEDACHGSAPIWKPGCSDRPTGYRDREAASTDHSLPSPTMRLRARNQESPTSPKPSLSRR